MMALQTQTACAVHWLAASSESDDGSGERAPFTHDVAPKQLRILVVEDEFFIALHTESLLQALGHVVVGSAVSAAQAVRLAERERPDVVLMDVRLLGPRDGIDAAGEILKRFGIESIFVTANTDAQTRQRALAVKPIAFLEKPLTEERLKAGLGLVNL